MRRKDREMDREFGLMVLDHCEYAMLAMLDANGAPYCVPLTIVRSGGAVYFHCAKAGQKTDCLRHSPRVCLTAVGATRMLPEQFATEYESAIVTGTATEVLDDVEKRDALRLLCERHVPSAMDGFETELAKDFPHVAVWRVDMETVTAKRMKEK